MLEIPVGSNPLALLYPEKAPKRAWRSRDFLAQLYDQNGQWRLSVNRAEIGSDGRWKDGITWDELQRIKSECGFGDRFAVEVFPPNEHVVNDANIRHLFLLDEKPAYSWTKDNRAWPI